MTLTEQMITIGLCVIGTMATRFLPFIIFNSKKPTPKYIEYLGKALPAAIFGMLVIYCLKNVSVFSGSHGLPELIAIIDRHCFPLQAVPFAICCWCRWYLYKKSAVQNMYD